VRSVSRGVSKACIPGFRKRLENKGASICGPKLTGVLLNYGVRRQPVPERGKAPPLAVGRLGHLTWGLSLPLRSPFAWISGISESGLFGR
jgi:hypothetical protein